jgi:actin-like protein 6A
VDATASTASSSDHTYVLPDGQAIDLNSRVGKDLCRIPELFFSDQLPYATSGDETSTSIVDQHHTLSNLSLPRLIHDSLSAVTDVDARKELAGAILLTGGCSQYDVLEQRLSLEVPRLVSSAFKCKVVASKHSIERSCAAWIGGSILTSLGSFQQLWLSRAEYDEYGAALAVQRFP